MLRGSRSAERRTNSIRRLVALASFIPIAACASSADGSPSDALPSETGERALTITADDGFPLAATLSTTSEPAPAVLLLHMCGQDRSGFDGLASQLESRGLNVLRMDFRSHGESQATDAFPVADFRKTPDDIETAFSYLTRLESVDPTRIGVVGSSCSVAYAVEVARNHDNVAAVAGLSGHTKADGREFFRTHPEVAFLGVGSFADLFRVKDVDGGDWIEIDAATSMRNVVDASSNQFTRWIAYEDAGHGLFMFDEQPQLEPEIAKWFSEVLRVN